ncbi:GDP-mannose-dependent alpha-mannosyltransferase [Rubripirellula lacrimiformis]|uniref:GDP-mannose-dependent alpha-mannosyltransferase n=1 Tax=Rubripirellula lacrimiformis TaxID=1930273 RepID=A0A517NGM2_9BACT|nr:glycosyltransferase [Rubripirellula lacrimiformis]QDT06285.1 GDP-mannose-dependent alpha-mannosyltransferase [Rubripirellula lacrimiformis]
MSESITTAEDAPMALRGRTPIRFLHVFPGYGRGGAELRVTRTINAMGPGGGHAVLSINGRNGAAAFLDESAKVPVIAGPPKRGPLRYPIDLWRCIRAINPAVILTYNWGATDAVLAAKLARFRPVIHNECGLSVDIDGKGARRTKMRRWLLPSCHRVVVTSFTLRDLCLRKYGVKQDQLAFIKTGVDTAKFAPGENDELRMRIKGPADGVVFAYIGSLRPSKNITMLIRAFAQGHRPGDRLALFGDGPERQSLESLATELGIHDSVYFHGYADQPRFAFQAADVYVTTSKSEAASNSLLEAMATGLPVITTDIADNRLMLSPSNTEFVFSHQDVDGYAAAIREMSINAQRRQDIGRNNRDHVCEHYPISRMFSEYAALWNSAADLR